MTEGISDNTIDQMSLTRIENLLNTIRDESYHPLPARRTYILKKNGKKRPLGISVFEDKLLQEVIRMVLEAIYENSFSPASHGFRPQRSCHTAIMQIKRTFTGAKWFIEGDISGFFDNINHDVLINILKEKIDDDRFIRLIRKFLNAGYVENWVFHTTYSGTPQGGIASPILANIYLDKLDKYMEEFKKRFDTGKARRGNPVQDKLWRRKETLVQQLQTEKEPQQRTALIKAIKAIEKERALIPPRDEMDNNYRRLQYVRYADDFIVAVISNLEDCRTIKQDIKNFLNDKLKLELSNEKTLITHANSPAKFLSYHLTISKSNLTKRNSKGALRRDYNKRLVIKIPPDTIKKKLIDYRVIKFKNNNGMEKWVPYYRPNLLYKDDLELLQHYNAEIRGFYNYYSLALNASSVHSFKHIMEYSMYKTFAAKYQTSVHKICSKYIKNDVFTVDYINKKGNVRSQFFYETGFKQKPKTVMYNVDIIPKVAYTYGTTSLIDRLKARKCELCESVDDLEMHHIRKMSDIKKGKQHWEKMMIARHRKTMAVCKSCHQKIHNGG
ncbi:reverse transcriptase/maturase family protein [Chitinophaga sp. S165]|uniref:reverse transcriptase/maturase family protein n=1 Tax=Chitinophaga sp. S165 TaxID=2135462 RepID=UPI001E433291|nr:reverse transcriptase/maturase family protein [Chitinophaga sp. S165]